ncbi:MAG: ABC transporter permease [Armatimonadota bacterium]|nr:ABC transporter permease [Armatimonadota bacterium]MDR7452671.1 ABC transporter permease [Armatimonadota bacterium]MDR7467731.1 ABC transporter permease [Armatimonadota bacterium]MDR7499804.1 ABC transporter permease [Armatimonadota bacterium]MDR7505250.1 ABC transporter permease [Armatimonadota bacterium]
MPPGEVLAGIFSVTFAAGVLRVTTPILLPALGGLLSDLAGVINIALEGTMLLAAFTGVAVSAYTHSAWLGLLAALAAAALFSLILAFVHLDLRADLILAGIAMNFLAGGGTVFVMYSLTGDKGTSSELASLTMPYVHIPILKSIPVLGPILSGQNLLVYVAFVMVLLVWWFLFRTVRGTHLRAVGANPDAAATAGIDVRKTRYTALVLSGLLAGLGGVHMSMGYLQLFQRDMTAGRGFIALAAVFLGARHPVGTMLAALLFGTADALANQLGTLRIPPQYVQVIPYVVTVAALAVHAAAQRRAAARRQHRLRVRPAAAE